MSELGPCRKMAQVPYLTTDFMTVHAGRGGTRTACTNFGRENVPLEDQDKGGRTTLRQCCEDRR
jgi:hypothetical protein